MKRKGRRGRRNDGEGDCKGGTIGMRMVTLLQCSPGNRTNVRGQPVFMVTMVHADGSIETLSLDLRDTKSLITDGLITLAEFNNEFAKYLINEYWRKSDPYKRDGGNTDSGFYDSNE